MIMLLAAILIAAGKIFGGVMLCLVFVIAIHLATTHWNHEYPGGWIMLRNLVIASIIIAAAVTLTGCGSMRGCPLDHLTCNIN